MLGRLIGAGLLRYFRTGMLLSFAAAAAALLVLTSVLSHGLTSMWTLLAVGLFNSVMFPSIFTLGLAGLGPLTSKGSSVMVAAIVGGALVSLLYGKSADLMGLQLAFLIPSLCYLYIAAFGFAARDLLTSNSMLKEAGQ